ncbi:hypothetical protein AZE42_05221 [Rhizopogon vesiculosus]|uniref:C2 domain-containing protein n=1 Tax=Rhizopogon vesiculosus TaxID=180088 RepID=A0A1J8QKV2_9AGAM|nr:hypothetical protein AZE42_05221 [Rhizopogon vesiculosus]
MSQLNLVPPQDMLLTPTTESPEEAYSVDEGSVHPSQVSVQITNIKASGLPKKIGLFSGQFYICIKGDNFTKQSKTTKYVKDGEYAAAWEDSITFDAMESSRIDVQVFARRCFFSYKIIKQTESNQCLGDLLGNTNAVAELELLGDGEPAGKVMFHISRSGGAASKGDA